MVDDVPAVEATPKDDDSLALDDRIMGLIKRVEAPPGE
jgi:hypothetical protein